MNNVRPHQGHLLCMLLLMAILAETTPATSIHRDPLTNQTHPQLTTQVSYLQRAWQQRIQKTSELQTTAKNSWVPDIGIPIGNPETTQQPNTTVIKLLGEPLAPERGVSKELKHFETSTNFDGARVTVSLKPSLSSAIPLTLSPRTSSPVTLSPPTTVESEVPQSPQKTHSDGATETFSLDTTLKPSLSSAIPATSHSTRSSSEVYETPVTTHSVPMREGGNAAVSLDKTRSSSETILETTRTSPSVTTPSTPIGSSSEASKRPATLHSEGAVTESLKTTLKPSLSSAIPMTTSQPKASSPVSKSQPTRVTKVSSQVPVMTISNGANMAIALDTLEPLLSSTKPAVTSEPTSTSSVSTLQPTASSETFQTTVKTQLDGAKVTVSLDTTLKPLVSSSIPVTTSQPRARTETYPKKHSTSLDSANIAVSIETTLKPTSSSAIPSTTAQTRVEAEVSSQTTPTRSIQKTSSTMEHSTQSTPVLVDHIVVHKEELSESWTSIPDPSGSIASHTRRKTNKPEDKATLFSVTQESIGFDSEESSIPYIWSTTQKLTTAVTPESTTTNTNIERFYEQKTRGTSRTTTPDTSRTATIKYERISGTSTQRPVTPPTSTTKISTPSNRKPFFESTVLTTTTEIIPEPTNHNNVSFIPVGQVRTVNPVRLDTTAKTSIDLVPSLKQTTSTPIINIVRSETSTLKVPEVSKNHMTQTVQTTTPDFVEVTKSSESKTPMKVESKTVPSTSYLNLEIPFLTTQMIPKLVDVIFTSSSAIPSTFTPLTTQQTTPVSLHTTNSISLEQKTSTTEVSTKPKVSTTQELTTLATSEPKTFKSIGSKLKTTENIVESKTNLESTIPTSSFTTPTAQNVSFATESTRLKTESDSTSKRTPTTSATINLPINSKVHEDAGSTSVIPITGLGNARIESSTSQQTTQDSIERTQPTISSKSQHSSTRKYFTNQSSTSKTLVMEKTTEISPPTIEPGKTSTPVKHKITSLKTTENPQSKIPTTYFTTQETMSSNFTSTIPSYAKEIAFSTTSPNSDVSGSKNSPAPKLTSLRPTIRDEILSSTISIPSPTMNTSRLEKPEITSSIERGMTTGIPKQMKSSILNPVIETKTTISSIVNPTSTEINALNNTNLKATKSSYVSETTPPNFKPTESSINSNPSNSTNWKKTEYSSVETSTNKESMKISQIKKEWSEITKPQNQTKSLLPKQEISTKRSDTTTAIFVAQSTTQGYKQEEIITIRTTAVGILKTNKQDIPLVVPSYEPTKDILKSQDDVKKFNMSKVYTTPTVYVESSSKTSLRPILLTTNKPSIQVQTKQEVTLHMNNTVTTVEPYRTTFKPNKNLTKTYKLNKTKTPKTTPIPTDAKPTISTPEETNFREEIIQTKKFKTVERTTPRNNILKTSVVTTTSKVHFETSTKPTILYFPTVWPTTKRRKTKLSKKIQNVSLTNNTDPLNSNQIPKTHLTPTNATFTTVRKQNSSLISATKETITSTATVYKTSNKTRVGINKTQYIPSSKSSSLDSGKFTNPNKLKTFKNEVTLEATVTTTETIDSVFLARDKIKTVRVKNNTTEKHNTRKKVQNRKLGKKIESNRREKSKSQEVSKSDGKDKVNHIEEILRQYYEEFKNRNVKTNNNERRYPKKSPTKRKLRLKTRPIANERKDSTSPTCIQSVVNRRYLNSSHSLMSFINKEILINYRSLEYWDLSHNALVRFNVSTLSNLNTVKYIALEYNNLTDLYPINFYNLRNLEFLDLSHNNITRIRNFTFFHMKSLKYLNLKGNSISKINATTLRGLQGLLYLDLSANQIEFLHEECLPKILKLKYLNLSQNKISTLAIANLKNIQIVDLSHNEIKSFSNITLGDLTNQMKILKVNNNLLEHLNENIFRNFSKLIYLDVSNNKLNYIAPSTFQYLDNLIFLNVSCQNILPPDQKGATYVIESSLENDENDSNVRNKQKSRNRSYGLKNANKKFLNEVSSEVVRGDDDLKNLQRRIGNNQKSKSKLLTGDGQKNTKQSIGNRITKRMNAQNKAKLVDSNVYLVKQKRGRNDKHMTTIQAIPDIIDFKLNLLASISQRLKQFECINVNLNQVPKVLTHSIQILNLKLNKIRIIQLGDLDDYPLLQILILSQNKIKSIETDSLGRLDYLKVLLADDNKLKYVPISLPENIEILNLNFNIISRISQEDFFDMVNLEKLYLQGNKIDIIPPNTFMFLRNLKYLDLSHNPIKKITSITLEKLNFINLSNLRNFESNTSDRFPIEDGYSLIGIKLTDSATLCHLLQNDEAFVLTLKQIKYLNCNQTDRGDDVMLRDTRNLSCENRTKAYESKMLNTLAPKSNASNRNRTKFMTSRRVMASGQTQTTECVNNESPAPPTPTGTYNSYTVRKRSNKAYSKTINSNLTVNNILVNVNKCKICKIDNVYEDSFEFTPSSVTSYMENIILFEDRLNYTETSRYYIHIIEEQRENCLHRGNKTRDKLLANSRNTDVNIENYTSMNNSTDVLNARTKSNMDSFRNGGKTSGNKIFMENSSENNGIFVITKDSDIPPGEYSFPHESSHRSYSKVTFRERKLDASYLNNMDFAMNDQAIFPEQHKNESNINQTKETHDEGKGEKPSPSGEENKFSIVRDSKKNVILKLNRNINNETEEKLTENYDQLEIKEASKKENNKENEDSSRVNSKQGYLIRGSKTFTDIKNNTTPRQGREETTRKPESIKLDFINSSYGTMGKNEKLIPVKSKPTKGSFYEDVKSNLGQSDERNLKPIKSNQRENEMYERNKARASSHIDYGTVHKSESMNTKESQINQIRSYLKNYQAIDTVDMEKEYNLLRDNQEKDSMNVYKDTQYEMNIVDTDAEFLDIVDDKTENTINDNTIRTLETSKYHELVSDNTIEGMEYHTGMIIFLMIVVFMIAGAFLALTFQWNSLLHSYCHHYVSYRNNGHSDDEGNTSDSNFDRIEMLDNVDVYSIA